MIGKVITVFNEKGGSGKTTTTCQLAGTLGLRGYDVLVADLDAQQTSAAWLSASEGVQFPATIWPGYRYGVNITNEIEKLTKKYEIVIADCAPSVEQPSTWGTLLVSDLALIPTKLNAPDLAAIPAAKRMAKKALQSAGRDFPIRVVANATRLHMVDDQAAMKLLGSDKEFPLIGVSLGDRRAFTRSMFKGTTAHTMPHGDDAVREIEALTDSVLKLLRLPLRAKKGGD